MGKSDQAKPRTRGEIPHDCLSHYSTVKILRIEMRTPVPRWRFTIGTHHDPSLQIPNWSLPQRTPVDGHDAKDGDGDGEAASDNCFEIYLPLSCELFVPKFGHSIHIYRRLRRHALDRMFRHRRVVWRMGSPREKKMPEKAHYLSPHDSGRDEQPVTTMTC